MPMYFLMLQARMYFDSLKPYFVTFFSRGMSILAQLKPVLLKQ